MEIKFRAKPCYRATKENVFVYGTFNYLYEKVIDPGSSANGRLRKRIDKGLIVNEYGSVEVLVETLGQFSNVYDKNHQPIYAGDVVECVSWNEYFSKDGEPLEAMRRKMEVVFDKGAFCLRERSPFQGIEDRYWPMITNGDCYVIGNIYDNPELIKNEQNFC